jgi:hypothetical protein
MIELIVLIAVCQFYNEPTTLVCPCGYRYPADEQDLEVRMDRDAMVEKVVIRRREESS